MIAWEGQPEERNDALCLCIRSGDFEDTRLCEIHGRDRAPEGNLAPVTGTECPF